MYRYISDALCSIHCKRMSLLNVESYFLLLYIVLFCVHVFVDDVIEKNLVTFLFLLQ